MVWTNWACLILAYPAIAADNARRFDDGQLLSLGASQVSPAMSPEDYPRPQMVRREWVNLSGAWEFAITQRDQMKPRDFRGQILIPFAVESALSGVKRRLTEQEKLWYRRAFTVPSGWLSGNVLLHFEASDWETRVWVNGHDEGVHRGGYDHFSFDITEALKSEGEQELVVSVYDPSEAGLQARGKQMLHPRETFYSSCSGIWQAVWLEPVPATYIESLKLVPDIDSRTVQVTAGPRGETNNLTVEAVAFEVGREVSRAKGGAGRPFRLSIPDAKLWSSDSPFLYDLNVRLLRGSRELDAVSSYLGMRKISVAKDHNGILRLRLNNKPLFQLGPLDQGYWPDGIYTAPSDQAMRHDIEVMKQLGFNLCRKHVKVEPDRWYYWCDKLGLLVWQDMPNCKVGKPGEDTKLSDEAARQFEQEIEAMVVGRGNHPSIVVWIAFNQGWGQYDTIRITDWIKSLDPSRLVIGASGWRDMGGGDVRSLHLYPGPALPVQDGKRACVLGECGGLGLVIPEHQWGRPGHWNITPFQTAEALTAGYQSLTSKIATLAEQNGLSGAVITQLTDVETEGSGFMTYDRVVIKMPLEAIREANAKVFEAAVRSISSPVTALRSTRNSTAETGSVVSDGLRDPTEDRQSEFESELPGRGGGQKMSSSQVLYVMAVLACSGGLVALVRKRSTTGESLCR